MAVGDIHSKERGSGARFNDGKDPLELVPVRFWLDTWSANFRHMQHGTILRNILTHVESIQEHRPVVEFRYAPEHLEAAAKVFDYGAKKYAKHNWTKGQNWSVPISCILRHTRAMVNGEEVDPESGEPHLGHVFCNVIMLDWFRKFYAEGDDLIPPEAFPHA